MTRKLDVHIAEKAQATVVTLGGVIDVDANLESVNLDPVNVVVDLEGVERMTAAGARVWREWVASMLSASKHVVLSRCSPAVVAQLNAVDRFPAAAEISSFFAPYFCSECDAEKIALCDRQNFRATPFAAPVCRCDECDLVMRFDDVSETYFDFLCNRSELTAAPPTEFRAAPRVRSRAQRARRPSHPLDFEFPSTPPELSAEAFHSATDLQPVEVAAPARQPSRGRVVMVAAVALFAACVVYVLSQWP